MPVFVLLALALAVLTLGLVLVAVRQLLMAVGRLRTVMDATAQRLQPLRDDLQAEVAVASTEAEALQERIASLQASRSGTGRRTGPPAGEADSLRGADALD